MSTVLVVTINEPLGRLSLSRVMTMGSEYDVEYAGHGDATPSMILTNPLTDEVLAQTDVDGVLKMNSVALVNYFKLNGKRPKTIFAYVYADSVVMASGNAIVQYSPLSFEIGADPELATGLADAIHAHVAARDNPHVVTLAQVGAAAASHGHDIGDLRFQFPDGKYYKFVALYAGGQPTFAFEETTPP